MELLFFRLDRFTRKILIKKLIHRFIKFNTVSFIGKTMSFIRSANIFNWQIFIPHGNYDLV